MLFFQPPKKQTDAQVRQSTAPVKHDWLAYIIVGVILGCAVVLVYLTVTVRP